MGSLPPAYTARVLAQLVPQFGPVEGLRVVRQEPAGDNTRYVCAITQQGAEKEYVFALTPAGQFAELNLPPPGTQKNRPFRPRRPDPTPSLDAPLRLVSGLILVEAEVDGRRGAFLLDSGAPALVLNQREFPAPAAETALAAGGGQGVNGRMAGASYHVTQRFNWQGISFQNQEVPTLDLTSLESRLGGGTLLGIIGYNIFSQYALTLNYRGGLVQLRRPGAAPVAAPAPLLRVPFTLAGHLPVVALTVAGQTFDVGVDCGAQTNLLDQQYEAALAPQLRQPATSRLSGADAASRPVTSGQLRAVRLAGPLVFHHQQTVFADISHLNQSPNRARLQGLVGYPCSASIARLLTT
ncbi:MAG: aspartyl protease family protein [Hymenobacter sp.]